MVKSILMVSEVNSILLWTLEEQKELSFVEIRRVPEFWRDFASFWWKKKELVKFWKKFISTIYLSNILGRTVDVQKTADFSMLIHSDMRFVIENWFLKFRHEARKQPTVRSSVKKIYNREPSNYFSLETDIKGTLSKNLKKIGWKLFEKKLLKKSKFAQSRNSFQNPQTLS